MLILIEVGFVVWVHGGVGGGGLGGGLVGFVEEGVQCVLAG